MDGLRARESSSWCSAGCRSTAGSPWVRTCSQNDAGSVGGDPAAEHGHIPLLPMPSNWVAELSNPPTTFVDLEAGTVEAVAVLGGDGE